MLKDAPEELEPINVPPDEAEYHFIDPALAVPTILTAPVPHLLPAVYPDTVGSVQEEQVKSSLSNTSIVLFIVLTLAYQFLPVAPFLRKGFPLLGLQEKLFPETV